MGQAFETINEDTKLVTTLDRSPWRRWEGHTQLGPSAPTLAVASQWNWGNARFQRHSEIAAANSTTGWWFFAYPSEK